MSVGENFNLFLGRLKLMTPSLFGKYDVIFKTKSNVNLLLTETEGEKLEMSGVCVCVSACIQVHTSVSHVLCV